MSTDATKYHLELLPFSQGLPPAAMDRLAGRATPLVIPSGAVVFQEGAQADSLHLIHRGEIALEMNVPGRGNVRILTLGPGELVGWSALLGSRMTATAIALSDCELLTFSATALRADCETDHEFGYHIMRRVADALAKRLLATRLQLLDLFGDVPASSATSSSATASKGL